MKRRFIQLITAVLYNCNLKGFADGRIFKGESKGLCVPGLNCYSCPGAVAACPLGSLQGALRDSSFRLVWYVIGTLLLFGIMLGRVICGFLCPLGFIQELIYKIHVPKIKKNKVTKALSYLKYVILLVFVIVIPVIMNVPGFCKYICPAGTLEAGIPLVIKDEHLRGMIGALFNWKVIVLCVCVLACMFCFRSFCRFICPLGAFYSFFNSVAFFGINVDETKCTGCKACISKCLMDTNKVGDHECIHCGACKDVCPEGVIKYKFRLKG
ncbi:MAG: 4Fe-4S binding protein [Lachnospiraceae bacterium]|nr:4Fe-4S binding protein [Lachnospiraceae bacterium]